MRQPFTANLFASYYCLPFFSPLYPPSPTP